MDFDIVRAIALGLPGVDEGHLHGFPSLKVSGRLLACPAIHRSTEPNSLVVRIGFEESAGLIASEPDVYYLTDHYANHPAVLVRLDQIDRNSLKKLLALAWRFANAKKANRRGLRRRQAS